MVDLLGGKGVGEGEGEGGGGGGEGGLALPRTCPSTHTSTYALAHTPPDAHCHTCTATPTHALLHTQCHTHRRLPGETV